MSLNIEDDSVLIKYNDIWKKNLKMLDMKLEACL